MRRGLFSAALALTLAAGLALPASAPAQESDPITRVASSDPEMNAAIAQARAGLKGFLAVLDGTPPKARDIAFKYPIAGWEHIWVTDVARKGNKLTGKLANNPHTAGYKLGQQVTVPLAKVSDWAWRGEDEVMRGHFTTAVLLGRMPPDQAAEIRAYYFWPPLEGKAAGAADLLRARMMRGESAMQGEALARAIKWAESSPLGSEANPVRVTLPRGQRLYLSRLRCSDGKAPKFTLVGDIGAGPYDNIVDLYRVSCPDALPAASNVYMDMYHGGYIESRAVPGFRIDNSQGAPEVPLKPEPAKPEPSG